MPKKLAPKLLAEMIVTKAFGKKPKLKSNPAAPATRLKKHLQLSTIDLETPTLTLGKYKHINGAIVDVIGAVHDGLDYQEYILYKNGGGNLTVLPLVEFLKAVQDADGREVARFSPIK